MPQLMRKLHENAFRRYLATGQRHLNWQGTEFTGLRKNGQEFPIEVSFGEIVTESGHTFTGFIRDVSARKRVEENLRRSEQRWRAVFENSAIGVALTDMTGRFLATNSAYQQMLGYSEEELTKLTFLELTLEDDHKRNRALVAELIDGKRSQFQIEKQYRRKDGRLIWVSNNVSLVPGTEDSPRFLMALSEEVTERKRAEDTFRLIVAGTAATTGSDFFQSLVQRMAQAFHARYAFVTACDDQKHARTLAFWKSDRFGENFEFDIADTPCEKVLHGEVCHFRLGLQGRFPLDKFLADWKADSYLGVPMLDRSNRVIGHMAILDIKPMEADSRTIDLLKIFASRAAAELKRQKAEDELRTTLQERERMRKELRDVIETIPTSAWTAVADGSVEFVNRRWREYTGLSGEGSSGSGWQAAVHPEDIGRHLDKWRTSLATGELFENEVRYRCSVDGKYRWFLARAVPLRDEQGNILKWYGISTDIEDRRRAEDLLAGEKRILEMVARGDSLAQILDSLCLLVEEQDPDVLASILLVEGDRLRYGGAPSLPKAYRDSTDGIVIGPRSGSWATAAFPGEQITVSDIATDPLWADYRDAALPHSLRTCWSRPVFSSEGKVIATFAMYYREARSPSPRDKEIIEQISQLAGVAIQHKLAEEKLRLSEAYSAEAQSLSHTGSWHWNVSTGEVAWSQEYCAIFGFDFETDQPSYQLFIERVHPEDRPKVEQVLWADVREKRNFDGEYRLLLPCGSIKYLHSLGKCSVSHSGDVEYIGAVVDITEHKRAEAALRRSESYLAEAQRLTHTGSWAGNVLTRKIFHSSDEHSRLYGIDPDRGIPSFEELYERIHPEDRARLLETFQRASRAGSDVDVHYRIVLPDGTTKYVEAVGHPIHSASGETGEFVGFLMDVTERRRAEEERERLRQAQADLAYINRISTMGELAASLAHEIRQPISAALTDAKTCLRWLSRDQPDVPEAREAASRLVKDATHATEIISRTGLLFKKGPLHRELIEVNEVIQEMIALLRIEAARYPITIHSELANRLPKLYADRIQIQQVLMNLMLNGIEAMKDMGSRGELTIKSQKKDDGQILVSVRDTGVGLPPEHEKHIFNAFFTTKPQGTGMGLAISRSIIESHGGHL
jgi:PAS domain S-box-containing protein